jgi:hypothetical protein
MSENFFPEISIFRIILIEKNEYYLFYSHDFIPSLNKDNINLNINLGTITLITKQRNSNNELIKYSNKNEITIKNTINESLLENDINILSNIINLLEGNNNNLVNVKIDLNDNQLKIISSMKKGINLILFKIDLICEKINNYNIIFDLGIQSFDKKKEIDNLFEEKLDFANEKEEKVKMKENLIERENNNKENKLLQFFCDELNKKKEIIRNLDNKINNISSSSKSQNNDIINNNDNIGKNNIKSDLNNSSNLNLSFLNNSSNNNVNNNDSPKSNKSNLSLSDLF